RLGLRVLAVLAFVGGLLCSRWLLDLDGVVRERFEGRPFRVPSRVFAAPAILYPGLDTKRADVRGQLLRLGYREQDGGADAPLAEGRFRVSPGRVRIHLRPFEHPTRGEPARDVVLRMSGSTIEQIRELPRGREVGAVLVEPEPVGAFYGSEHEERELVRIDEVPQHLIDAILAVEDRRFESHHGIDPVRIAGAFLANLRAGSITQGGSTLTQQLVKNFFLTPERSYTRKATEAAMALLVEARYDKPEILQAYLNEIYLGQRGSTAVHGVGEAAHFVFGKRVRDLTLGEAATIAAIIQSPNRLSPHRNAEDAILRRNLVLELMRGQGRIDAAQQAAAVAEPLGVAEITPDPGDARYFLDLLRRQLPEVYDEAMLEAEGLRIYSTLDLRLQRAAAKALDEGLAQLEKEHPSLAAKTASERLQGCIIALRPQTGEILALVGGRDYGLSQFDRCAQARRQVGSVFKPFVYAAALEGRAGGPLITLASFVDDEPFEVATPQGSWRPKNFDGEFHGRVGVREAIERSMNVAAARLGQEVGIARVADMARRLGVESSLPNVPSLALGTAELAPLEVARAYATLAAGGVRPWPHAFEDVVDAHVGALERRELRFDRVLDEGTAFLVTSLLRGVVDRGTAARVRSMGMEGPIAGKTGTTDDERDLWFAGYTPELVAVVWIGFDTPRSLGVSSSRGAIPIWVRFMKEAVGTSVRGAFPKPPEVETFEIDPESGAIAAATCPQHRDEYFLSGTEPDSVCTYRGIRSREEESFWSRFGNGREEDRDAPPQRRRRGILDWLRGRL
ncbi:MAG: PBP1A family penicillin-binding protein, partial [Myxococcales bacterium]|nr:PBP1A family penicillin-binding protein [Myxococcales bacterium]